ncbi:hypothetical protein BDY24DRAFT_380747 [Mrakia frigida]|uniref:uncharacterized protein n=1 Tax=Mrakia frigida TaxID=29902 RepID=UPI003FCC0EDA
MSSSEIYQKDELLALIKQEGNSKCADCQAPNPQWCSLAFANFVCLDCSGVHRGMGVHITFVRSATMDKWSEDQLRKMKLGGNTNFQNFVASYGPTGGYRPNMKIAEKYATHAALQYKEKLTAICSVPPQEWSPSPPPPPSSTPASASSSRPSSAQGVRKPRGYGNGGSSGLSRETEGGSGGFEDDEASRRKAANEDFFSSMGSKNESRRDDLPPSQGGKYGGFGSTPEPSSSNNHPSFALSSQNAPSLDEIRSDPLKAASKGWGLFSAAVSAASRTVQSTIVDPTIQTLSDPALSSNLRTSFGTVASSAQKFGTQANGFVKERSGVDFVGKFGELGLAGGSGTSRGGGGYSQASMNDEDDEQRPSYGGGYSDKGWGGDFGKKKSGGEDGEGDDFLAIFGDKPTLNTKKPAPSAAASSSKSKKDDEWDDW